MIAVSNGSRYLQTAPISVPFLQSAQVAINFACSVTAIISTPIHHATIAGPGEHQMRASVRIDKLSVARVVTKTPRKERNPE